MKIFIVDDVFSLGLYEKQLRSFGYTDIATFHNGAGALSRLGDNPMAIILDYNMGDMNGIEILKMIKKYDPRIYVIMVSGQEGLDLAANALHHGAFDYILKDGQETQKIKATLEQINGILQIINYKGRPSPTT